MQKYTFMSHFICCLMPRFTHALSLFVVLLYTFDFGSFSQLVSDWSTLTHRLCFPEESLFQREHSVKLSKRLASAARRRWRIRGGEVVPLFCREQCVPTLTPIRGGQRSLSSCCLRHLTPLFLFSSSLPFKMSVLVHSSPDIWTELRSAIDHIYSDYTEEPVLDELSTNRGRHCVTEVLPSLLRRKPAL